MTAKIINFQEQIKTRICSFCKNPEDMCKKFIASTVTSHCICGDCVKVATERAKDEK